MSPSRIVFICTLLIVFAYGNSFGCTVLYCSKDGIILAGNNEDWKDPLTKMWIYPPDNGKHGWIKFGFGNGFPQGGMNDQGLFWDATAGPYMEMPFSESNKTLYGGALMQKVIEESSSSAQAKEILQAFYCQDQYRAQYLIGDALGSSMISEGDSIITMQDETLVLTNFYHSNPDLGGYPCWRYSKAMELLGGCDTVTPYFIGTVLASTHQEGEYPTQYSNIYDLRSKTIYLFFCHNYEEFLVIDLMEEMEKGYRSYEIPSIFSKVALINPGHKETIQGNTAEISWRGLPGREYRIIYSTNPDLSESMSVTARHIQGDQENKASMALLFPLVLLFMLLWKKQARRGIILFLASVTISGVQCEKERGPEEAESAIEYSATLAELEENTTYFWKIEATNTDLGTFTTETVVRTFLTVGQ